MLSMGMYYPGEACTLSKVSESSLRPLQGLTLHQLQALNTASSNCSDLSPEYTDPGHVLRGNSHKETTKPVTRGETADTSRQDRSHAQKVESSGGHGVVVQRMCSASGPGGSDGTGRARTAGQEAKGRTPTPDCRQRHHGFQRHKHKGRPYSRHNMLGVLSVDQKTLHKRRGISREREEGQPLPETLDDPLHSGYGYNFDVGYNQCVNVYGYGDRSYSDSEQSSSAQTSPTQTEGRQSWLSFSNGWTTGNTTERSSTYSLGEDEFDRKASHRVRQLFEQIDRMLFEDSTSPQHLYAECQQWVSRFPHLRILGKQLLQPKDLGYQVVPQSPQPGEDSLLYDVTDQDITATHALNELSITGQHVDARVPPVDSFSHFSERHDSQDPTPYENEEVFDQDGQIEDIIAVDYKTADEESSDRYKHRPPRQRHTGMPPLTPQACLKDNIGSTTFDLIWPEVISWLRDVLKKYTFVIQSYDADDEERRSLSLCLPEAQSPQQDILPASRETSLLNSGRLDRVTRLPLGVATQYPETRGLDGLLTISTKALQSRDRTVLGEQMSAEALAQALPLAIVGARPGSSVGRYMMRPNSVKPHESRLTSARLRTAAGRGRLAPLERTKTPSMDEDRTMLQNEVIRGHRLATMNDSNYTTTPPLSFQRNGALPPIGIDSQEPIPAAKKVHLTGRASSAVHDKEGRHPFKDRDRMAMPQDGRPSTTHAMYRSDTPLSNRRSMTPLSFSSNRMAQGMAALTLGSNANVLQLDVRGNSLNPHNETDGADMEDSEQLDEMIHTQWDPHRGRLIHSSVFRNYEGAPHIPLRRTPKPQYSMGSVR